MRRRQQQQRPQQMQGDASLFTRRNCFLAGVNCISFVILIYEISLFNSTLHMTSVRSWRKTLRSVPYAVYLSFDERDKTNYFLDKSDRSHCC